MTLLDAQYNKKYIVQGMGSYESVLRRLQALGLNDGAHLSILNKKNHGALIISVRGTRLALGKHIQTLINIEEDKDES